MSRPPLPVLTSSLPSFLMTSLPFSSAVSVPTIHLFLSSLPRRFQPLRSLPLNGMTAFSPERASVARARIAAKVAKVQEKTRMGILLERWAGSRRKRPPLPLEPAGRLCVIGDGKGPKGKGKLWRQDFILPMRSAKHGQDEILPHGQGASAVAAVCPAMPATAPSARKGRSACEKTGGLRLAGQEDDRTVAARFHLADETRETWQDEILPHGQGASAVAGVCQPCRQLLDQLGRKDRLVEKQVIGELRRARQDVACGLAGQEDDRQIRLLAAKQAGQRLAAEVRHVQIGDQEIDGAVGVMMGE